MAGSWGIGEKKSSGLDARESRDHRRSDKRNGLGGGGEGVPAIESFQEIKEENLVGRGRKDQQSPGSKGPLERKRIEKEQGGLQNPVALRGGSN